MRERFIYATVVAVAIALANCGGHKPERISVKATKPVGGGCDGCELMFIGMPSAIDAIDTSLGWNEAGQKLVVTGTVFKPNGRTPAPDVVLYYWQTDNDGLYSPTENMPQAAKRHGHLRGWVKTGADGRYTIHTIRPAPYPGKTVPAHIHLAIKEPGIANEYYTDEINFDDDKLLLPYLKKHPAENRGGSGIVRVLLQDSILVAEHNIILGLNIPGYPEQATSGRQSGLSIGHAQPSFIPFHAYGPDKGTRTCPVCKYGRYHGILYFVGNKPNWDAIKRWLKFLESEAQRRQSYLKVYFVYGNENSYNQTERQNQLEQLGTDLHLKQTALTFLPSFSDEESEAYKNKIDPNAANTFVVYKQGRIVDKYVDLEPTVKNFEQLQAALNRTRGDYFHLPVMSNE